MEEKLNINLNLKSVTSQINHNTTNKKLSLDIKNCQKTQNLLLQAYIKISKVIIFHLLGLLEDQSERASNINKFETSFERIQGMHIYLTLH